MTIEQAKKRLQTMRLESTERRVRYWNAARVKHHNNEYELRLLGWEDGFIRCCDDVLLMLNQQ